MSRVKRHSQKEEIREVLESGRSISSFEAFKEFRITRLSALIFDLKNIDGLDIVTEYKVVYNEYGNRTRYAIYSLRKIKE